MAEQYEELILPGEQSRIDEFLPPDDLKVLKKYMGHDELWVLATLRQVKEHGFGRIEATINDGEINLLDATQRRKNVGKLDLVMA